MERISPRSLQLVVLALTACAAIGLWMGLSDSLRRNAPAWEGGMGSGGPVPTTGSGPPEAVALDKAVTLQDLSSPPPSATPAARPPETKVAQKADDGPAATEIVSTAPLAIPPAPKTPPAKAPAAKTPAPKADPIGDAIQEKQAADPPPEVPF